MPFISALLPGRRLTLDVWRLLTPGWVALGLLAAASRCVAADLDVMQLMIHPSATQSAEPDRYGPKVLRVGPTRPIRTLGEASRAARDGDTVLIDAGRYSGDVASWPQNRLSLRASDGEVIIDAAGAAAQGKAIFVISGDQVEVEGLTFSGCRVADHNGAGIRHEGGRLIVRKSKFLDNENGILTSSKPAQSLEVYNSVFIGNGDGVGYAHGIYVGLIGSFRLEASYVSKGRQGHLVKSRARQNFIFYNRLTDEDGSASYELEFPNGGQAQVVGNIIGQAATTANPTIVAFGMEGLGKWPADTLMMAFNTIVSAPVAGCQFVRLARGAELMLRQNLFSGSGCTLPDTGFATANKTVPSEAFVAAGRFDYRLTDRYRTPEAPLADALRSPPYQYQHPAGTRPRLSGGAAFGALD